MSLDKYKVYDALARHTQAYPLKADGVTEWTTAERIDAILVIKAEADAKLAELAAAEAAAIDTTEQDTALLAIMEQELIDEQAGLNRQDVIDELNANIAALKIKLGL